MPTLGLVVLLVLPEVWRTDVTNGALMTVNLFNVSVEDAAFEVLDLLARVYFAEVSKVMEADEFMGCLAHGVDVEPAFSSSFCLCCELFGHSKEADRAGCWCEGGLGEEVFVTAFFTRKAGREVEGWGRAPCQYPNVGWQEPVEYSTVW